MWPMENLRWWKQYLVFRYYIFLIFQLALPFVINVSLGFPCINIILCCFWHSFAILRLILQRQWFSSFSIIVFIKFVYSSSEVFQSLFGSWIKFLFELTTSFNLWSTCWLPFPYLQTVRFKNELERNITIKLGYANAKIYKCEDERCPRPMCYKWVHSKLMQFFLLISFWLSINCFKPLF